MKLSVITACLPARAEFLAEAAASVPARLVLSTGSCDVEWVVVFDGPGCTPAVSSAAATTVIQTSQREGVSAARNRALLAATGSWVVNLDGDDTLVPAGLGAVAQAIEDHEALGWAAGVLLNDDGTTYPPRTDASNTTWLPGQLVDRWTVPMAFHPGVSWMRRDLLIAAGGWPALSVVEDKLPVFTVSEMAAGVTLPNVTHVYRRHPGQTTASDAQSSGRDHALAFTVEVLTSRRRLMNPSAARVEPRRLS